MAKFKDADGRIVMRSTKQTDKQKARKVAETWEDAARLARSGELTQAASIKILSELMERTTGERLEVQTIENFLRTWAGDRKGVKNVTADRYEVIVGEFIELLGPKRARASISSLTGRDVEKFRDKQIADGKSASTANQFVAVIRAALNSARRKGLCLSNVADSVEKIVGDSEERDPFTSEEVRALLRVAGDTEWRGMILLGVHCGVRIADAARLQWSALNLEKRTLNIFPSKIQKEGKKPKKVIVALHEDLVTYFNGLQRGIGQAPLFPLLSTRPSGSLSARFSTLIKKAGVTFRLGPEKEGKGRRFKSKGFHSFRHTFISKLADADVSSDVRKVMAGHSSDEIHKRYTHLSLETQERAVAKLPSVL